jgi:prepilin-type N-terminal cleavage/methylation domain-containing protein
MKQQRGFTLLEMMVVVAIVAILAGILIPNFTRARAQAATSACMANEKTIATALELYYTDHQNYPASGSVDSTFVSGMTGYMNQIPIDPAAGSSKYYAYATTTTGGVTTYTITCPGAHDPNTLMALTGGASTTNTKIQYDSQNGFSTSP